jgi:hypothetical protein
MSERPGRKLLAILDETRECRAAVLFAAHRARETGGGLVRLHVMEPLDPALWSALGASARAEAEATREALIETYLVLAAAAYGAPPEVQRREGDIRTEITRLLDADRAIKILVLGAGVGREGPGPLVAALARGGLSSSARSIPITVVPGDLNDTEIAALAA